MRTAMQELITHLEMLKSRVDMVDVDSLIEYATNSLEKEKEQIIDAGNGGVLINFLHREKIAKMSDDELRVSLVEDTISYGEQYFNQTYNQNK